MLGLGGNVVRLVGLYHSGRCVYCRDLMKCPKRTGNPIPRHDCMLLEFSMVIALHSCQWTPPHWYSIKTLMSCKDALAAMHRGAHTFFLRTGQVPRWGGYTVNLIHYEDAAGLSAAVCLRHTSGYAVALLHCIGHHLQPQNTDQHVVQQGH